MPFATAVPIRRTLFFVRKSVEECGKRAKLTENVLTRTIADRLADEDCDVATNVGFVDD